MKNQKLQRIGIIFLSLFFASPVAYAGVFDNDEENWRRIFRDIKKINSRLVTLETGKMKALANSQQDLSLQVDEIKSLIPSLQGAVEQSQSEVTGRFEATIRKLADIEKQIKQDMIRNVNQQLSRINAEVTSQLNQQTIANEKFQANLATQFDQLKGHMAGDMDKIANINKGSFQELVQSNNQSFAKVVEQLKAQQQNLDSYKQVIKSDLIPTIVQQNEKTSTQLLTGMSKSNKENKKTLTAGLESLEAKNQLLVEILKKNLKEGEVTRGNVERLSLNVDATNNNVLKLKDALVLQLDSLSQAQQALVAEVGNGSLQMNQKVEGVHQNLMVAGEKINKLAESLKGIQAQTHSSEERVASLQQSLEKMKGDNALNGEKINKLISSSTKLATNSNAMNLSLQSVGQSLKTIEGGMTGVEASNQKLTKLIDILKVMATEQGKLTQVLAGQGDIKQSQNQILTTQVELNKVQVEMSRVQAQMSNAAKAKGQIDPSQAQILKAQKSLKQAQSQVIKTQAQILKAQEKIINAQRQSLRDQAEAKKLLAELSRKANVNISRNDAIRKTLSNIGKRSASTPSR